MKLRKTDNQQQLRKVAILVATLEESLAERMLADLPAREAALVQTMVEQLGPIDPAEYREVVADFRRGLDDTAHRPTAVQPPSHVEGVELDESLLARMAAQESSPVEMHSESWDTLNNAESDTLAKMLSAEQPQTIAVVLSRLEPSRAAELIANFPPSLQAEVLSRLAELDPADQQTLKVVESQLATWITRQRNRQQRLAAGRDLVERILQSTHETERAALLTQISKQNLTLANELSVRSPSKQPTAPTSSPPPSYPYPSRMSQAAIPPTPTITTAPAPLNDNPLSELEALDDQSLLTALRYAERQVVMLALAGASEGLMKRILRGLPRRQASQFRKQVREIGPTRLSDMLAAQRELVRHAQDSATH